MNLEILAPSLHCAAKGLVSRHDVRRRIWLFVQLGKGRKRRTVVQICSTLWKKGRTSGNSDSTARRNVVEEGNQQAEHK